ncbi:Type II/IV secretion system ATP hydrolase TadA/VirB11/CpaF, TadA subfamily [hydrothermal vent metagenome]|uniref:Type II/IV secretion system ATP hydrolase TadA/VirB11/CpaF, TadA subfamily n=1 Tax=hydrothermal vent metagenome TaxID=652676 RepID=A0A3B1DT92_9ZZZZ
MLDAELREKVNRFLINETDFFQVKDTMTEDQLRNFVNQSITDVCEQDNVHLEPEQRPTLIREIIGAVISMGPLRPLMEDSSITEIMVNGAKQVYIQRNGRIELTKITFEDTRKLTHTVQRILSGSGSNKRADESSPYVDFSLADGSRVNVILPPCSMIGPVMTIRKFKDDIGSVENLLELGMLDERIAALLIAAMQAKLNVIFCGSTGAGKTTMLNVFSRHIPEEERIITIEDTPELRLLQKHVVSLASKPANIEGKGEISMRELFINSLRMRPDRIIIGEVRGEELLDLIESISSGHSGSLAIVHAETPEDCFNRMVTMMLMTGIRLSTEEIQKQIVKAVDLVVHAELFMDGKRRVTAVTDFCYDNETDKVVLRDIFAFQQKSVTEQGNIIGEWVLDKKEPSFLEKFKKRRVELPEGFFT